MDINAIKQRLSSLQTSNSSGKKEKIDYSKYYWKPKTEGKYQIRIVPSVLNKENPFQEIFVHYGFAKFPVYALTNWGEKDPIVEMANQLRDAGGSDNWKLAKKLDPKMRVFAPVVVRGEEDKGVRLWEFGKEIYMQLLGIAEDEDYGDFTDIKEGRDFTVEIVPNDSGVGGKIKIGSIRIKPKTSPLSPDASQIKSWLSDQPNVLELQKKSTFEDVKNMLVKFLNPDAEEETVTEEATDTPNDLPWEDSSTTATSNYSMKGKAKTSKAEKFDAMFEDEE
jgi:hypothetical protein